MQGIEKFVRRGVVFSLSAATRAIPIFP